MQYCIVIDHAISRPAYIMFIVEGFNVLLSRKWNQKAHVISLYLYFQTLVPLTSIASEALQTQNKLLGTSTLWVNPIRTTYLEPSGAGLSLKILAYKWWLE